MFPHRLEAGVEFLTSIGFKVNIGSNALGVQGSVSGTPQERADDIHALFADAGISAIIASIGGDHSNELLPLLDWDLIRANPKVFVGMSDITVLNLAIQVETGMVTFNGPMVCFPLAEYPIAHAYTADSFARTLMDTEPVGAIQPAPSWTDEFLDWSTKADQERPRTLRRSDGWTWLKDGYATGPLIGGCLESLEHLRGTPWWPDFDGALLFLETSEEKPDPDTVGAILMDYENMGVLEQIAGLLFANPYGYTDDERQQLREVILERTSRFAFPIVTDMDFGHTQPMFLLPVGCRAEIDSAAQRFSIVESGVDPDTPTR